MCLSGFTVRVWNKSRFGCFFYNLLDWFLNWVWHIELASLSNLAPNCVGVDISSWLNDISGDFTFFCADRMGNDWDNEWYFVWQVMQPLRVCVALSDGSRLAHFSVVNVAKNSSFEPTGCHFLLNILVIGANLFATTLYDTFRFWGIREVMVIIM